MLALSPWLAVLVAAFVAQCLAWAWVSAGLRRVRSDAALVEPLAAGEGDGPPTASGVAAASGVAVSGVAVSVVAVSVVVAAHNEAERLPALLEALAEQTHRPFEVVVVDDRSTDATAGVVRDWADRVPVRLVQVAEGAPEAAGLPPKKHALERGVEAARHARIAFTDADGRPGPGWLAALSRWSRLGPTVEDGGPLANGEAAAAAAQQDAPTAPPPLPGDPDTRAAGPLAAGGPASDGPGAPDGPGAGASLAAAAPPTARDGGAVLVGYGPYAEAPGWLNRFVRYETVQTAALAAAAVGWGRPWHAVGRNLSVPGGLLGRLGGYAHSAGSLSGDDDLLVQEVARRGAAPVVYVWEAAAAVPSPAPPDAGAFWRQKRRHASAGTHYPAGVLAGLGLFHASNLALWVGAPLLHVVAGYPIGWGMLAAKMLLQRSVLAGALDDLGDAPDLRLWQPVLDAASAVYHAGLAALALLPTPRRW